MESRLNGLLTGMTIKEADIETIARAAEQGEESLRQIYDWAYQAETLTIQLIAALWVAVVGALVASFLSVASTRGYLFYWRQWLAFVVSIILLSLVLYHNSQQRVRRFKDRFLDGLRSYQKKRATKKAGG